MSLGTSVSASSSKMKTTDSTGSKTSEMRSTKGCWTCRLRRKKCDERHPSCQNCRRLDIICQGYGPKPFWMDRGALEREEAEKVKLAIARNGKTSKRHHRSRSNAHNPRDEVHHEALGLIEQDTALLTIPLSPREPRRPLGPGVPSTNTPSSCFVMSSEDEFMLDQIVSSHSSAGSLHSSKDRSEGAAMSPWSTMSTSILSGLQNGTGTDINLDLAGDYFSHQFSNVTTHRADQPRESEVNPFVTSSGLHFDSQLNGCKGSISTHQHSTLCTKPLCVENSILLSHYLENVLHAQFPFNGVSVKETRQWLQFAVCCSDAVLQMSLVLSKAHLVSNNNQDANLYQEDMEKTTDILHSLPSDAAVISITDTEQKYMQTLVACTCLLQAVYIEILHRGSSQWEGYLVQAAPYMNILTDLALHTTESQATMISTPDILSRLKIAAAKSILGQLTWFDILATMSSGRGPFLGINHGSVLESNVFTMEDIRGCQNEVAHSLCEVFTLQNWKKQEEAQGSLSIMELASRAVAIHHSLKHWVGRHSSSSKSLNNTHDTEWPDRSVNQAEKKTQISLTFARAAIIYLHIIVSGPNPQLQEIREDCTALLLSFGTLGRLGGLEYVSWPLCVMACFAQNEEWAALNRLLWSKNTFTSMKHSGACSDALEIAQECRRLRTEEGRASDWVLGMQNLQKYMILF